MKISLLKGIAITALLFSYGSNFATVSNDSAQQIINETQKTQLTGKEAQAAIINNTAIKYFAAIVGRLNCHVLSSIKNKDKKKIKKTFDSNKETYIATITDIANDKEIISDTLLSSIIDKNAQKITKELKKIKDVESTAKFYSTMEKCYASEIAATIAINDDNLNIQKNILQSLKSIIHYMIGTYSLVATKDDTLEGRYNKALKCALEVGMLELIENICKAFKDKGHIVHNIFEKEDEYNLVRFKQLQEELSTKIKTVKSAIHDLVAVAQVYSYESLKQFENNITVAYNDIKANAKITKIKTVEFNEQKARELNNRLKPEESALNVSQKDYRKNRKSIIAASRPSTEAVKLEKFNEKKHLAFIASNNFGYRLNKNDLFIQKGSSSGEDYFAKSSNTIKSINDLQTGDKKYINDKLIKGWAENVTVDGQSFVYLYTAKGTKIYLLADLTANSKPKKLDSVNQFFTINNVSGSISYTLWKKGKRHYESTGTSTSLADLITQSQTSQTIEVDSVHSSETEPAAPAIIPEAPVAPAITAEATTTVPSAPAITAEAPTTVPPAPAITMETPTTVPPAPAIIPEPPAIIKIEDKTQSAGSKIEHKSLSQDLQSEIKNFDRNSFKKKVIEDNKISNSNGDITNDLRTVMEKRRADIAHSEDDDADDAWSD